MRRGLLPDCPYPCGLRPGQGVLEAASGHIGPQPGTQSARHPAALAGNAPGRDKKVCRSVEIPYVLFQTAARPRRSCRRQMRALPGPVFAARAARQEFRLRVTLEAFSLNFITTEDTEHTEKCFWSAATSLTSRRTPNSRSYPIEWRLMRTSSWLLAPGFWLLFLLAAPNASHRGFEDITAESGVRFTHVSSKTSEKYLP